jgi:HEAT repeat protein
MSEPTMHALIDAVVEAPELAGAARDLVRQAPEPALHSMALQAVAHKEAGVRAAEDILGRRVLDILASAAPKAQWYQIGPIVQRLAAENEPQFMAAVQEALARTDEQSRREAAQGVAASGSAQAAALLTPLVSDSSTEVAVVAVRAVAKNQIAGGAALLDKRLGQIDLDGKDFLLAREIIGALARMPDPEAGEALKRLGSRKALIKRGHFAEVQELVRQAQQLRAGGGAK